MNTKFETKEIHLHAVLDLHSSFAIISFVTLGYSFHLPKPQFPHMQKGESNSTYAQVLSL